MIRHPAAELVGLDASREILEHAREALPRDRVDLRVGYLEDALPAGPFDLAVSVLAVHHLDAAGKARLFRRVANSLTPEGRFVFGDFVIPGDPSDIVSHLDPEYDTPSTVSEQLQWLSTAGLEPRVAWSHRDLAVLEGERASATAT